MERLNKTKSTSFESYDGHRFLLRLLVDEEANGPEVSFIKSPYEENIEVTCDQNQQFELFVQSPYDTISENVDLALKDCGEFVDNPNELAACLSPHLSHDYFKLLKKQDDIVQYRDLLIDKLRNYTCDDDSLNSTPPISTSPEVINGREYQVDSHLLLEEAQIFVIHNFISDSECNILKTSAAPRLERAVVVGNDEMPVVSESRRAQQASYNLRSAADPLWFLTFKYLSHSSRDLYYRILNFTNSHTNYNLRPEGQEHFTVIQYNESDEYM